MLLETARHITLWRLSMLLALALMAGCSGKARHPSTAGSNCYAKALPSAGEGGLAWGDTLNMARKKSLANCIRYAGRSGGTPGTCKVVLAECRK